MIVSAVMLLLKRQWQLVMFGTAGIINTAVDWLLYFLIAGALGQSELLAKLTGTVGGVTSAFLLSILWVFKDSFLWQLRRVENGVGKVRFILTKYVQTVTVYAVGMLLNVGVFFACKYLGMPDLVCLTIATFCSFIVNFTLSKKMVFRAKPAAD